MNFEKIQFKICAKTRAGTRNGTGTRTSNGTEARNRKSMRPKQLDLDRSIPLVVGTPSVPTRKVENLILFTENKPSHQISLFFVRYSFRVHLVPYFVNRAPNI